MYIILQSVILFTMTGECCYWYAQFPATATCNRTTISMNLTLSCNVQYWLSDNTTKVEVRWYRSKSEQSAGIEGVRLNHTRKTGPVTSNTVTFIQYYLEISRSTSDQGYYWCQMIVNGDPLPPSPFGFINSSHCTQAEVTCDLRNRPYCAQNQSSRLMAQIENAVNCLIDTFIDSRITTMPLSNSVTDNNGHLQYSIGISVGTVLVVIILVFILIALLFLFCRKRRKTGK